MLRLYRATDCGPPRIVSFHLDHLARIYQSQANNKDSMAKGVDSSKKQCELFEMSGPSILSGKMFTVPSHQMTGKTFRQYSDALPTSATMRVTPSSTPNGSESPSVDVEFFSSGCVMESPEEPIFSRLADVLLKSVEEKYNLSPKAAAGIQRRAKKRGKELPPQLAQALSIVAGE